MTNLKIAICEDNECDAEELIRLVQELENVSMADRFLSAEHLLLAYSEGKRYDLIFMDIQLPGKNGFDAAKFIHTEYQGERPLVVFLTITDKYVFEAYNVGWDYVCKPINSDRIRSLYERACAELSYRKITLQTNQGFVCFETKDIFYIEAYYGVVSIVSTHGTYQARSTLDDIYRLLANRPFCKSHRCYLVNLRHVISYTQKDIWIADGKSIPLSRNQRKAFVESLENFHRGSYYG